MIYPGANPLRVIPEFRGYYHFLSNFHLCPVMYRGVLFPSSEHAFQAAKLKDGPESPHWFQFTSAAPKRLTPAEAKWLGRNIPKQLGWDAMRDGIMLTILLDKFTRNPDLGVLLLATGDATLIEGNSWGDYYWGVCAGKGENHLGYWLMTVRAILRERA